MRSADGIMSPSCDARDAPLRQPWSMLLDDLVLEVLCLICQELDLRSIISLRQVSLFFSDLTHSRALWLSFLRSRLSEGCFLPHYIQDYRQLDTDTLESLVHRLTTLLPKWTSMSSAPATLVRLDLSLSVTWVQLVAGTWLLVASSNDRESQLSCYDLATPGTTHAYLPGCVRTAKAEIQDDGIVLALGLTHEAHALHVVTLRKPASETRNIFCQLAQLQGSSHVLMLSGDFVGCAVRGALNTPHLFNWRTGVVYEMEPPPGGLDLPVRRSVPHLMVLWGDQLVVVRTNCLEIYDMWHDTSTASFSQLIEVSGIWEVSVCSPVDAAPQSLSLVAISPAGIEMLSLHKLDDTIQLDQAVLVQMPTRPEPGTRQLPAIEHPLICSLRVGASGRRMLWISAAEASADALKYSLRLFQAPITTTIEKHHLCSTFENDEDPALWGVASLDFDDALGLVTVANVFGELAVFDYGSEPPFREHRWTKDLAYSPGPLPPRLSSDPIPLNTLPALRRSMTDEEMCQSRWCLARPPLRNHFPSEYLWAGTPCDDAWLLDHAYGFPGEVLLQAFRDEGDTNETGTEGIVFYVGDRFFYRSDDDCLHPHSCSLPADALDQIIGVAAAAQLPTCATALTVQYAYSNFFAREGGEWLWDGSEYGLRRNRWDELCARGGRPAVGW
ncbi:hypothetical protein HMN09_00290300 [Mycena chlorophos]|uniref:F-box domain-containing protein n=1 Tax=Mycena chlorophos TaxID=658473 RepID=A0A8H6TMN7_MYCCL|nr:hypothetical protein HMN09_00290300 [Mycena chlorophos]